MTKKIFIWAVACLGLGLTSSCQKEEEALDIECINAAHTRLSGTAQSNVFDEWLNDNFLKPYNVEVMYKFIDRENKQTANLLPAYLDKSMVLAGVVKHAWFDVYGELYGNSKLLQGYAPRQLVFVGTPEYNRNGTMTLGTAENGIKITLYNTNNIDVTDLEQLNFWFLGTLHHEFMHILHQNKMYDPSYENITKGKYTNQWNEETKIEQYAPLGYVTAYSRQSPEEDFTEVTAKYITWNKSQWDELYAAAGEEGSAKIRQKVQVVKAYMLNTWNCDLDKLRDIALRRAKELPKLNYIRPEWQDLLKEEKPTPNK